MRKPECIVKLIFKFWNSCMECILKPLEVPDIVLTSRLSYAAVPRPPGRNALAMHLKCMGLLGTANNPLKQIKAHLNSNLINLQQLYRLSSTSASRMGAVANALLSAW